MKRVKYSVKRSRTSCLNRTVFDVRFPGTLALPCIRIRVKGGVGFCWDYLSIRDGDTQSSHNPPRDDLGIMAGKIERPCPFPLGLPVSIH